MFITDLTQQGQCDSGAKLLPREAGTEPPPAWQAPVAKCLQPYSYAVFCLSTGTKRGQNRPLEGSSVEKTCAAFLWLTNIHFYELEASGSLPCIKKCISLGCCRMYLSWPAHYYFIVITLIPS